MDDFFKKMLPKRYSGDNENGRMLAHASGIDALDEIGPIGPVLVALLEAAMNYEPADGGIREVGQALRFELNGVSVEPLDEKGGKPIGDLMKLGTYEIIVRRVS